MAEFRNAFVIVDGSNVVSWQSQVPLVKRLILIHDALRQLRCAEFELRVDPTLKNYQQLPENGRQMLKKMTLQGEVKETPDEADPWIINRAKNRNGFIVTNDLFRDHPHLWSQLPGRLVKVEFDEPSTVTFKLAGGRPFSVNVRQGETLEWIALEYEGSALENKSVGNRDRGFRDRDDFLRKYPFRNLPDTIGQRIRTREDIYHFLALIRALWPLGSIGQLNLDEAADAAAEQIEHFRDLLKKTFGSHSVAKKIDDWNIPQFGGSGERMIAKKIIAVYYPDETIPIFRTDKLKHHCKRLGLNISAASIDTLTIGQKWERLTNVLLAAKKQHPVLREEDNVYFMYLLEDTLDMSQMT